MSTSRSSTVTIKQRIRKIFAIKKPWIKKTVKYCWIFFLVIIIGFPLYIFTVKIDLFGLYGPMPKTRELENPKNDLSSQLMSADGVTLGRYGRFNRSQVNYEELSEELRKTLVISEDHRFYNHSGLDFQAFVRVAAGILTFNPKGGGSTITQQLAKNLYTINPEDSLDGHIAKLGALPARVVQKTKEWMISINLESNFTKEEIITMYLNTANFSSNSFGIKVASETYFDKAPDSLNLQESAVLVGMLQSPSAYNPKRNPERSLKKRNEVLWKVFQHKYKIKTRAQYDSIVKLPIELHYSVQNQNQGIATYFRTVTGNWLMKYCKDKNLDLWGDGLKIYTTIDSRLQKYAEEAMYEHMKVNQEKFSREWKARGRNPWVDEDGHEIKDFLKRRIKQTETYRNLVAKYGEGNDSINIMLNLKKPMTVFSYKGERDTVFSSMDSLNYYKRFLQSGLISMDPTTGYIKAWVGGVNHKYFKFDHVKQAARQPGSTFKPFVYGLAMEMKYSPCHPMKDISPIFKVPGGTWSPKNALGDYGNGEVMTIRQAMARSVNSITGQLMQALQPVNVVDFAHRVGIESKLEPVPSLCLGVNDVTLFEMAGAYGTFVNGGLHTTPIYITRIEDRNGNVIENFVPKMRESIDEQTAFKMIYMLQGGVQERGGTSGLLPMEVKIDNEIGGKTGTTNDASDGWYMGVTHDLVTGIWVGGDERGIHFPSWGAGSGAVSALPIWGIYMKKAYADKNTGIVKGFFKRPSSGLDISLDCGRHAVGSDTTLVEDQQPMKLD